jgi:hypothetical protein
VPAGRRQYEQAAAAADALRRPTVDAAAYLAPDPQAASGRLLRAMTTRAGEAGWLEAQAKPIG